MMCGHLVVMAFYIDSFYIDQHLKILVQYTERLCFLNWNKEFKARQRQVKTKQDYIPHYHTERTPNMLSSNKIAH